jgi:glycosyltransferase involved in cell wall biosynthesis
MLYGMPVISRYNGAISDVVTHEENGFLTDSVDPVVFSDFLQRLTDDTELYQKIAINNHLKAIQSFTKEKVKNRILDIYSELLLSTEK